MTLGELIQHLESAPKDNYVRYSFELSDLVPTNFTSYRGWNKQLALGYTMHKNVTVQELLSECKKALNQYFEGYKGGLYLMTEETILYLANLGDATGFVITSCFTTGNITYLIIEKD